MAGPYRIQVNGKDYYFSRLEEVIILVNQSSNDQLDVYYLDVAKVTLDFQVGKVDIDSVQVTPHVTNSYGHSSQPEMLASFLILTELCAKQFLLEQLRQLNDSGISTLINNHNINFEKIPNNLSLHNMLMKTNQVLEKIMSKKYQSPGRIVSLFQSMPITDIQNKVSYMLNQCGIENFKSLQSVESAINTLKSTIHFDNHQSVTR